MTIDLSDKALIERLLCSEDDDELACRLIDEADMLTRQVYGRQVFLRALIEISSYCKNNCYYCGLRRDSREAHRERLSESRIIEAAVAAYTDDIRTVVLQGGEDAYFTDERLVEIIRQIKQVCPGMAVTLSLGERGRASFKRLRQAGADRYLLRHETATESHYRRLHPEEMKFGHRMKCLDDLRALGYQVGAGFMVGSPYQTVEHIVADLRYLAEFQPEMIGIGPFIPARGTPFESCPAGSARVTLRLISIIRILCPSALIPATTAIATLLPDGHQAGLRAGANVVMANFTPEAQRQAYTIYNNKAAESFASLRAKISASGYTIPVGRGDHKSFIQ